MAGVGVRGGENRVTHELSGGGIEAGSHHGGGAGKVLEGQLIAVGEGLALVLIDEPEGAVRGGEKGRAGVSSGVAVHGDRLAPRTAVIDGVDQLGGVVSAAVSVAAGVDQNRSVASRAEDGLGVAVGALDERGKLGGLSLAAHEVVLAAAEPLGFLLKVA